MASNVKARTHTGITAELVRKSRRHARASGGGGRGFSAAQTFDDVGPLAAGIVGPASTGWSIVESLGTGGLTVIGGDVYYEPGHYITSIFINFSASAAGDYYVDFGDEVAGTMAFYRHGTGNSLSATGNSYFTTQTQAGLFFRLLDGPSGETLTMTEAYLAVTRLGDAPA